MARALDRRKQQEWAKRFERFRASGMTVAHFCDHEQISVKTFYYWSKRVASAAVMERRHTAGEALGRATAAVQAVASCDGNEGADAKSAALVLVRFRFGSVEVDVPAGCLEVIRCLAESAGRSGSPVARPTPGAFHEIVLGARR
jgi:hypothetical protein